MPTYIDNNYQKKLADLLVCSFLVRIDPLISLQLMFEVGYILTRRRQSKGDKYIEAKVHFP